MKNRVFTLVLILFLLSLYPLSRFNYLLFHTLVEVWAMVVACAIFLLAWNTKDLIPENYLFFLGGGYLFVAIITFFHAITFYGVNIFPEIGPNPATQFWMLGRFLETFVLFVTPLLVGYELQKRWLYFSFLGMGLYTLLGIVSILIVPVFPTCFEEGVGLTPFKVYSEYIIVLVLLLLLFILYRRRKEEESRSLVDFSPAIILTILAELSFTLYTDVYGFFNFLGHIFYLISFYLIYRIVFTQALKNPTSFLFHKLQEAERNVRAVNQCLLSFDQDNQQNIQRIVTTAGELFQGDGASFNQRTDAYLQVKAQWKMPGLHSYPVHDSLCERVMEQERDQPLYLNNLEYSPYALKDPRLQETPYTAILGSPIITEGQVRGTLVVFYQKEKRPSRESLQTLSTFAQILNDELTRLNLYQIQRRGLDRARTLQESLFPTQLPSFPDLIPATCYRQAQETSGDYFNIHSCEEGIFFLMVDVTGQGLDAALITVFVSSFFRREMKSRSQSPTEFLTRLHQDFLQQGFPDDYFLEAFCGYLDKTSKEFSYAAAGSIRALKINQEREIQWLPKSTGSIINNYLSEPILGEGQSHLGKGEALLIYTDGVDEPFLITDEKGGEKRMAHFSQQLFHLLPFQEMLERIIGDTAEDLEEHGLQDDMAILGFFHCHTQGEKHWTIPEDPQKIAPFIQHIMAALSHLPLDFVPVQMALQEAVNNALEHWENKGVVHALWTREELILRVQDDGPGFNWKKRLQKSKPLLNTENPRGRGIQIIQLTAQSLAFHEQGNGIAMGWRLEKRE